MKEIFKKICLVIVFLITTLSSHSSVLFDHPTDSSFKPDSLSEQFASYADNEVCFKCHSGARYEYENPETGKIMRRLMPMDKILSREVYYMSVHKNFSCTDCHSYDFNTFPHPAELIFEEHPACIDCHGGDEAFAQYHFEEIEVEYQASVHYGHEGDGFSCWKCHDPHGYVPTVRRSDDFSEIVNFANDMCLSCHTNFDRYQLLTDHGELDIVQTHEWLPNQALHFTKVRCIECHTQINDTILVAHLLLPKSEAVQRCTECHSQNTRLMETLYKFKSREQRKSGFFNGIIINESYVIGANRNEYLSIISFIILAGTFFGIGIHVFFRILNSKKVKHES